MNVQHKIDSILSFGGEHAAKLIDFITKGNEAAVVIGGVAVVDLDGSALSVGPHVIKGRMWDMCSNYIFLDIDFKQRGFPGAILHIMGDDDYVIAPCLIRYWGDYAAAIYDFWWLPEDVKDELLHRAYDRGHAPGYDEAVSEAGSLRDLAVMAYNAGRSVGRKG